MNHPRRTFLIADRPVQGALLWRVILYWQFLVLSISVVLLGWDIYLSPSSSFADVARTTYARYSPALFVSLLLLPIVMLDLVRITNRIVGPVARLRHGLRDVADGRPAQPLNFRDSDFWRELAGDFNRAAARMVTSSSERSNPTEEMPPAAAGRRS